MRSDEEGEAAEPERKKTKRGGKSHQRKLRREERLRREQEARDQQSDEEEQQAQRRVYLEEEDPQGYVSYKDARRLVPKASLREQHTSAPAEGEETASSATLQRIQGLGLKAPPARPPQVPLPATAPVDHSASSSSSSSSTYRPAVPPVPPPPPSAPPTAPAAVRLPGKLEPPGIKQYPPPSPPPSEAGPYVNVEPKEEVAESDLAEELELEIVGKQKTPK